MTSALGFALLPFALTAAVFAGVTPTAPGPGQTFNAGSNCTIQWDVDQSETWKNVTIDLMSGSNSNMSFVTNVAWGLDGTDPTLTPFNWTCPEVDPYAPIYFYQFTNGLTGNVTWTTRFTIASSSAEYFSPTNATQPNGDPIPWGTGILAANGTDSTSTSSSGGTTKSSGPAPSASSVKKSHPSSSAEPSAAATGAAISPDSAAPTPALPPTSKKPHPTSASASAGGPSASKATHAAGSTNTCSCSSSDQPSGLSKLLNGGAREVEKVSGWTHLFVPLVIALLVLY
ncbi:uncharacterized protein PHACADRAFT_85619 [Phanerochaete carnosa HHB-10118-sp]|uniref:Yeast cell wall synthesis Kre9/Knh1-like N-terminal domain-containing protein n=1 Tax=Phanerochaete carnosa (strain HHB-10118-sp) TaxID=650164 RepID=K5VAJ9_PHACS|nr:uncharacterized protein PHACADRAFT_85619 [Phanerochaete carnosa HHB-10118-sp]EKM59876.1 hypothetical protein PHACADRAFT_85619 [Phanerochaete carnosa HHB-10118-sp]